MEKSRKLTIAVQVAEHLRGTCSTLHGVLADHGDEGLENDADFCAKLDELVFECEECNWWCEVGEGDGAKCDDCMDKEEEDDE